MIDCATYSTKFKIKKCATYSTKSKIKNVLYVAQKIISGQK